MKRTYFTPIMMIEHPVMMMSILKGSKPHINDDGNVEFPDEGDGESGDADEGCVKEIIELIENEKDPFVDGLW